MYTNCFHYLLFSVIFALFLFHSSSSLKNDLLNVKINNIQQQVISYESLFSLNYNQSLLISITNPVLIYSLSHKNITSAKDLENKRIAIQFPLRDVMSYYFKYENLNVNNVDYVDFLSCNCARNSFEAFDAFIFPFKSQKLFLSSCSKNSEEYFYNWNDFNLINLPIPFELLTFQNDKVMDDSIVKENVVNYFTNNYLHYNNMTELLSNNTKYNETKSDTGNVYNYNLNLMKVNYGMITNETLSFLQYLLKSKGNTNSKIRSINSNLFSSSLFTFMFNETFGNQINNYSNQNSNWWIENNLLNNLNYISSSKFLCFEKYSNTIYLCDQYKSTVLYDTYLNEVCTYFTIFWGIIYFILLLPMFNKPSIKIRLILPYSAPLYVLIANLIYIIPIITRCGEIIMLFQVLLAALIIGTYGVTLFRVVFLRNCYYLIEKFSDKNIKYIKMMSSKNFGIILTIILSILYALFWFIIALILNLVLPFKDASMIGINLLYGLCVLVSIVFGILCMIIEVLANVSKIRKEGLRNFLFFDDPFYQRLDLIFITLIFLVVIPIPIGNQMATAILKTIAYCLVYFISGGTSLFFEYWTFISNHLTCCKGNKEIYTNVKEGKSSEIEKKLSNDSYFKLLRKYAEKEFSLENILLYEQLMNLKEKYSTNGLEITKEEIEHLFKNFIEDYSKYEVNLSSKVKVEFSQIFNNYDSTKIGYQRLKSLIIDDLMLNIADTCKRLEKTTEYKKWLDLMNLQKELHVV
ncbi:hypothetical protein ABK040_010840 [Willaertia magna]